MDPLRGVFRVGRTIFLKNDVLGLIIFFLFYVTPVTLLWFGIIPFKSYYWFLVLFPFWIIPYALWRKFIHEYPGKQFSFKGITKEFLTSFARDLGLRKDNLKASLFSNAIFSFLAILGMLILFFLGIKRETSSHEWDFYVFYVLISSSVQELFYRSIVFSEFSYRKMQRLPFIILSSVNFCFAHVFFFDGTTLLLTLFAGIVWGIIYSKHPNFFGVTFSHTLLGSFAIYLGFIN